MDEYRPRPFLTSEEGWRQMEVLGFRFDRDNLLKDGQEKEFQALLNLIAGAIAEWSDCRPEGEESFRELDSELQEFAQEFLVG